MEDKLGGSGPRFILIGNTGTGDVGFVRPRIFIQETSIISSCELFAPRNRKWRDRLGGSGPRFIAVGRQ